MRLYKFWFRNINLWAVYLFLLAFVSCNKDDSDATTLLLADGVWRVEKIAEYNVTNDLEIPYLTNFPKEKCHRLTLNSDKTLMYYDCYLERNFDGNWDAKKNRFSSNVQIDVVRYNGYGHHEVFPDEEIVELSATKLVLKSNVRRESQGPPEFNYYEYYNIVTFVKD